MNDDETNDVRAAAEVCTFMMQLSYEHAERFHAACANEMPFGDLAYGKALQHWRTSGAPDVSFFSYAEGEDPCPALMEFRKELTARFGLPILTSEEAKKRQADLVKEVRDWGRAN